MTATARNGDTKRVPILALPLVPPSSRLTNLLLADPLTPTPSSLLSVPDSSPSLLRRSRGVGEGSHFSYVTPLCLEFPYNLEHAEDGDGKTESAQDEAIEQKRVEAMNDEQKQEYRMQKSKEAMEKVEAMLRPYELQPSAIASGGDPTDRLTGYLPLGRARQSFPSSRLLGISTACLEDCLPHLDVGDSLQWIAAHSGKDDPDSYSSGPIVETATQQADSDAAARRELSDYLSGRLIGAQLPDLQDSKVEVGAELGVAEAKHLQVVRLQEKQEGETKEQRWTRRSTALKKRLDGPKEWTGYAPWANAYSGHQFGVWAGQLGDGRAITLMETLNPLTKERWELQLKGAGRTPYSRFADGLAVLASSVREYLASEALARLGVPTSRALSVISIKDVPVIRERRVSAAITSRLAPIWTRIGSFEHHADRKEWESIRLLVDFVCQEGYGWNVKNNEQQQEQGKGTAGLTERMVRECTIRNAKMVAGWQSVGFMHGVINTDNVSLIGITIDFGPYAFMDKHDPNQICNKSDGEGRYTYRMQPSMGLYAIEKLFEAVSPLIGFERAKGRSPYPGELVRMSDEEIEGYRWKSHEAIGEDVKNLFMDTLIDEWKRLWRNKLALITEKEDDRDVLIDPLLTLLEDCDFSSSLRRLSQVTEHLDNPEDFARTWLDWNMVPSYARESKQEAAAKWLKEYCARLKAEGRGATELQQHLRSSNPAFILRNWVTDEVVARLEEKDDTDFLDKILQMCLHPFDEPIDEEAKRLCQFGQPLVYNMPSCSS